MAYMSQDRKNKIAPKVKALLKKYRLKGSLSVRHNSTLVLTIRAGAIDFIGNYNETVSQRYPDQNRRAVNYIDVNTYYCDKYFSGVASDALCELIAAMNDGNHDNSDAMTDYFDVGWYVDVHVGKWDKPYIHEAI